MVNYTLGEGFKHLLEFEVRPSSGEICIAGELDYERRSSYEFPVLATDRGGLSTTAMIKLQLLDVNDNRPVFYPREYNVSLREASPSTATATPIVAVVATDADAGDFGKVFYRIVAGNEAGIFRIERSSGEIFVVRPDLLSVRTQPRHMLNISATDGGGLRTSSDAVVFLSIIDAMQRPPIFEKARYNYYVKEDMPRGTVVGTVTATSSDSAQRSAVRYSIYSGDPDGYFGIEASSGQIRIAHPLDHEAKAQVLLNIQATSGEPPVYGHTQVNIEVEDVNDNAPEFETLMVRISVPENADLGTPLFAAHAHDKDSGRSGQVSYSLSSASRYSNATQSQSMLFAIDARSGHLVLSRHLDYETAQRHTLIVTATDAGVPPLSADLTILVDVQDVNDNPPVFERDEYAVNVSESWAINAQIIQVNASDLDTGNNARITYRIADAPTGLTNQVDADIAQHFGIFPNSGWIYLRAALDRESRDRYELTVLATDNGTPAAHARARVLIGVLDANDNDPKFQRERYEFKIEENQRRGAAVGVVKASDLDIGENAAIRYSLLPINSSFQVHPVTGEITTREPLDRELRETYDLILEARDQGTPMRSARVAVRVHVTDVNDNAPEIADPQEAVVSVREEQPPGSEVVRIRAVDRDYGQNASISYSLLKGHDSDGHGLFSIDASSGVIRTRVVLDHEEGSIYKLVVAATDGGNPPKQTLRKLRVEVLNLNDNRPTFTSSSLVFRVREDAAVGHVLGSISANEQRAELPLPQLSSNSLDDLSSEQLYVTYTLNSLSKDLIEGAFDIDRNTGNLVVARQLDRELQSEFKLEIRALDTTASNNPQSSAITVKIEVADVNDNAPHWALDPIELQVSESLQLGSIIYNFTATDADTGTNGELQYRLLRYSPLLNESQEQTLPMFTLDSLTGALSLQSQLDFEAVPEYLLIIQALDQSSNVSERLQTSVTVRLRVQDANDNAPQFVLPQPSSSNQATVYLSDATRIGELVAHVLAVDSDAADNGRVSYEIISGNGEGRFRLQPQTGIIELARSLPSASDQLDKQVRFTLTIKATDHGSPALHAKLSLQLILQGSHNHPPRFLQSVYQATILENVPSGSFVLKVGAKAFHGADNANLSYEIPAGVAENHFQVDWQRGIVTTRGQFDREQQARYTLPIYVRDANRLSSAAAEAAVRKQRSSEQSAEQASGQHFDVATLVITIGDVNDNAPEFRQGVCYGLAVPENSEAAVIHTLVASDADEGVNADIVYSIIGGNLGNKFSIDAHTGELTASALDREQHSRYTLQLQASDRGQPFSQQGRCNISVFVEDQNDNAPRFELAKYVASVLEDAAIGSSVLQIKASDADLGVNAKLIYSLANETQWQFAIDSSSGLITTVGKLDRELQSSYSFMVLATDGGRYQVRSASVSVQLNVLDVNDNKPVFERYPYSAQVPALIQPGQTLLKVQAHDADQGVNGEVLYALKADSALGSHATRSKFRINPNTGALSATQSLASEAGKLLQLEIIARDKGNPPQSSVGLVELLVGGEAAQQTPLLRFQNETYRVKLRENSATGTRLLQVAAVRSDGRRQKLQFSFGAGNDEGIFTLDASTGEIHVANPTLLDYDRFATPTLLPYSRARALSYETTTVEPPQSSSSNSSRSQRAANSFPLAATQPHELRLVLVARSTEPPYLSSYAQLLVELEDENDNAPQFSQRQFVATAWEGQSKGTFVAQVQAFDADEEANARLRYHIVDGNHDNAFVIEPAFSGIVRTNIVLDREIRDVYNLKIIATDEGVPQMTGTATIRVLIVDVNDNQPTFPPNNIVSISEARIANSLSIDSGPPYIIVAEAGVETDLAIDRTTGEIRTKLRLDRETRASYSLVAIPLSGLNVRVVVTVRDENDNAPSFAQSSMHIEFPENTPREVKRTLLPARDLDLEPYNTQRYNIVSGNVNDAFRLSPHRERDGVLYLDLQISGFLDRETTPAYSLLIEALDGGNPPLRGLMTVNITIQDVNDNQPIFNQSRYFATVPENATVGSSVLQVYASDTDAGENGLVEYAINRRQSDKEQMFRIDARTGAVYINKPLDFETKELHELVVVAKDHGEQPLETTAFVSIRVTDVNDNQPTINVIFLSDDASPKISESAQPGEFVARISVHDPDSKTEYANVNVSLNGGDGHFALTTRDNSIYLVIVNLPLDREFISNYTLSVVATDKGTPPLHAAKSIFLRVTDVNDNAPEFEQQIYHANVMEVADPGSSVLQLHARDRDEGKNALISYSLADTPETHAQWFQIDAHTGLITTRSHIDCETEPVPQLTVIARDNGEPQLSASATVLVTIHDVNDNEPIFDQSFYNVSVAENEPVGRCILKVSASDPDCGVNAMVNYTLGEGFKHLLEFEVRPSSGEICIAGELDYERRSSYEFPVLATDRGGLSTTAMIKLQLLDVNDNRPVFYPREYNVSLREASPSTATATPIVAVVATDADAGDFGKVFYRIVAGNEAGIFRIERSSGEIFVVRPDLLSVRTQPRHMLNISATDGGGLRTSSDAVVFLSIIDAMQRPPIFEKARYNYYVKEDMPRGTVVGTVTATSSDSAQRSAVRYSIYSGDPDGYFGIEASSGQIRIAHPLDHEAKAQVLLNIQATSGEPPVYGHTQVNIEVEDVNDNAPEFETLMVRISVPENAELGTPLFAAHAHDKDSGRSGQVSYSLSSASRYSNATQSQSMLFAIDARSGHLVLSRHLDYETAQRHTLIVTATDAGVPPLSADLTILVDVQDVNDNPPVFERDEYAVNVSESRAINAQIIQVNASDLDTGNNARITYRIADAPTGLTNQVDADIAQHFGIFPNSGWIYLRAALDRESRDRYELTVLATDNGTPAAHARARVLIGVLDANDNDPKFQRERYEFKIEENQRRGAAVGVVKARDMEIGENAAIRYSLLPINSSFQVHPVTGEITTREPLDRELRETYDLILEARDQGTPMRSARVAVRVHVTDVNDNAPEIADPQEAVVSVREEQPPGSEVVRIRAVDRDYGQNASISYSLLKGHDSDGHGLFSIDASSGVIRTRVVLDHEEGSIYKLVVAATDGGNPPKQTLRKLRVEVLNLNDNRPTFTSSSLVFRVREDAAVGHVLGSISANEQRAELPLPQLSSNSLDDLSSEQLYVTYTLNSLSKDLIEGAFDIDRNTGNLVVARQLDRELQSEFKLEIRALDTTASNNPQSSAITVKIEVADVNDNAPHWALDPIELQVSESLQLGSIIYNFTATDADTGTNGELQYRLLRYSPLLNESQEQTLPMFTLDSLTGALSLQSQLDFEAVPEYLLIIQALDQSSNVSERLQTSVTVRLRVQDANDNAPQFVLPQPSSSNQATVYLSDATRIGELVAHVLAVDSDAADNGRVSYEIISGNGEGRFRLQPQTGIIELARSLPSASDQLDKQVRFTLTIKATDHGSPALHAKLSLQLILQGSHNHPPRFLQSVYQATILENVPSGSFVLKVGAKAFHGADNANLSYEIPAGVAENHFQVDWQRGIVTTRGQFDREQQARYTLPIYVRDANRLSSAAAEAAVRKQRSSEQSAEQASGQHFDVATLVITIGDVNDNAPEFRQGVCYGLAVPENSEAAVIHTLVASDADEGVNADIVYSIIGGNLGNKFSIDAHTGELTASALDREQHSRYTLQLQASDRGQPFSQQGRCNISVFVEDQNDNAPRFELAKYVASVLEDAAIGSSVLQIKASDADLGVNAKLIYSLANETQWQFAIDSSSGLITTVGKLDRELQSSYSFMVLATDGGRYQVRSASVSVQLNVLDVNDNKPVFERYPYSAQVPALIQPGQTLLKVQAHDADQGVNGEVLYALKADSALGSHATRSKFRINPNTGALSATQSLASEAGKLLQLEIIARDKGNPPQSSVGLVELLVGGEAAQQTPLLRFQNETYRVKLRENSATGTRLLQVAAVRSDGRRQKLQFSFGAGNDEGIFTLDASTGEIHVANPTLLDYDRFATPTLLPYSRARALSYETTTVEPPQSSSSNSSRSQRAANSFPLAATQPHELRLVLVARSTEPPYLSSYAQLLVELEDENDNAPQFSQRQFVATAWEGQSKGTFVAQVQAFDADEEANARLRYHIVDGNHDNAFVIEPAFSGIVRTNIVLDREIRDVYNLKIIATDEGVPQMTGTATIRVLIVDVNDNQPTFPPNNIVSISEATEVGTVISTVSANDVDTYPALTYRLGSDSPIETEKLAMFGLDRYSGKLVLKQRLDYEQQQEYQLEVIASDAEHEAHTTLTVRVLDENDNAPEFQAQEPPAYFALLPAASAEAEAQELQLLTVNATDADGEGVNAQVSYSIEPPHEGFSVQASTGVVYVNTSSLPALGAASGGDYFVNLVARDAGKPQMSGRSVLRVQHEDSGAARWTQLLQTQYRAQIGEEAPLGTVLLQLGQEPALREQQLTLAAAGNEDGAFELLASKALVLVKPLDRERNELYKLRLLLSNMPSVAGITVIVSVLDANDNAPQFDPSAKYEAELSELAPLRYSIAQLQALDADEPNTRKSEVVYEISSGKDEHMFSIELLSGVLFVNNRLDYDSGATSYELIIRACDSHQTRPLCSLRAFRLSLHDENDNAPQFPLTEYVHALAENEPVGSSIFQAHASDKDRGAFGQLNYSLVASADDAQRLFRIDALSGMLSSAAVFDFEQRQRYQLQLQAMDMGGRYTRVQLRVQIESRDEFTPQFTERSYRFVLPASAALPLGYVVGQVLATDADSGADGRVVYQLSGSHNYFKVNRSSGAVLLRRKLDDNLMADVSLLILASSGRHNSLTNTTLVEIALDPLAHLSTNLAAVGSASGTGSGVSDWLVVLLVTLLLILCGAAGIFLYIHMRSRRPRNAIKPQLSSDQVGVSGGNSNSYVDPSAFDTMPMRGAAAGAGGAVASGQFAPPKYDEIPPFGAHASSSGAATTSELSGSEQSGSSGRGSAEDDGEDEEIRMINEGPLRAGVPGSDDGRISDISVQNTQQYLARLGIVDHDPSGSAAGGGVGAASMSSSMALPTMHMFEDEAASARSDITNLIYAKLNDVAGAGSERGSSADDAATTAGSIGTVSHAHGHGYGEVAVPVPVPVVVGGSNVGGSLSSIVHSEEELTGSYNWDYLLDWGPQYQPLAHVFSEIARLKDDTMSEHSAHSAKSKHSSAHSGAGSVLLKPPHANSAHLPPPLLTNVAPRAINLRLPPHLGLAGLPRSPIGHEASGGFSTSSAMSPSFSPSLSPLATRSPSISPLGGPPTHMSHVSLPRHAPQPSQRANVGTRM
ncbi:ds [Drosophila busckii]|uniref:Ds n=1 Tax=Drosophila busckii TaxID=30019 RepID=A0A0M5IVU2_DROBS|nr:ds [Drosophila busckii]